jgi:ribosomal protein S11/alpha-tubulin suppressor-like RCC1 family protein
MSNLLLIDKRIDGYDVVINSLKPDVYYIGFDVTEIYEECEDKTSPVPMASSSFHYMLNKIKDLGISSFDNVGILQHNFNSPYHKFFGVLLAETSTVSSVELIDPSLDSWAGFEDFITFLKNVYGTQHIDLMACALYSNPNWKYVIDTLAQRVGIEIRASTDNTGDVNLGGNWFLESHTNVNLKTIYFTDGIDSFNGILIIGMANNTDTYSSFQLPTFTGTPSRPTRPTYPSLPALPSFPANLSVPTGGMSGALVAWGNLTSGVPYSDVSSNLQSDVLYVFTYGQAAAALKTDGSLFKWGKVRSETTTQFNTLIPTGSTLSGVVSVVHTADSAIALKSNGSIVGWGMFTGWPAFPSTLSSGVVRMVSTIGDIVCLKSDGSVRGWGMNFFASSPIPSPVYPAGANVNSGVVKLVGTNWPGACAALKSDGSVAYFGVSGGLAMTNHTVLYPSGSNITSGVVDVVVGSNAGLFVALKNDGSIVIWGGNASSSAAAVTNITATKIMKTSDNTIIIFKSDNTYLVLPSYANTVRGSETNIVDVLESNRLLVLRNDGTLAWRGGTSFEYYFGVDISVHTDVVKIFNVNYPYNGFNPGGIVLKSNGELRYLDNTLITSNVNDVHADGSSISIYIKSNGSAGVYGTPAYTGLDLSANVVFANSNGASGMAIVVPTVPTFTTFSVASTKVYGDPSFAILTRPTSNSAGAITYTSNNTNVATIDASGNWITLVGVGDVSFNAVQAATSQYAASTKTSNTLTVSIGNPSIITSFTVTNTNKAYGDASFAILTRPTTNSSGAITYTSNNTAVATIDASGNWINIVGVGDVSFNASQAAVPNQFIARTLTSDTLTVSLGTPTISSSTFTVTNVSKAYGDPPFAILTRPTSNSSGAITYTSSNTAVATIDASGNWINIVGVGDVSFNASQAAVPNQFTSGSRTSGPLTISKGTPALAFVSPPSTKFITDASFSVNATSGVAINVSNSGSGAYVINGSSNPTLTVIRGMKYIFSVDASGHPFWIQTVAGAYSSGNVYSTIANNGQDVGTIVWEVALDTPNTLYYACQYHSSMIGTINVIDGPIVASSNGAITYASSDISLATVHPSTGSVTLKAVGSVTITASQALTTLYNAPSNATCSISIQSAGTALQGTTVTSGTSYASLDLSGASLVGTTVSGVSFSGANLSNVDFSGAVVTGTDFTNVNLSGATNLPAFSPVQKLQLLKNINNTGIGQVQVSGTLSGSVISSLLDSPSDIVNNATFVVKAPASIDGSGNKVVSVSVSDISGSNSVYIPLNANESAKINNTVYLFNGSNIIDVSGNVVNFIIISGIPFKIYAGSIVAVNVMNEINKIIISFPDGLKIGLYDLITEMFALK